MNYKDKENQPYGHHNKQHISQKTNQINDMDNIMMILNHQQETIAQMQRQIQRKVNKTQMNYKISAKKGQTLDITSISFDNHQCRSTTLQNNNSQQDYHKQIKTDLQLFKNQVKQSLQQMKISTFQQKMNDFVKQIQENHQNVILKLQKKCQRSQLDKTMHLTSLLAIEFELIKKRFNSFETDYNLIWKQISKLYTHQQNLRSAVQTERKDLLQNNHQKYLEVLFKNSKNPICTNLFNSYNSSYKEEQNPSQESSRRTNQNYHNLHKFQQKLQKIHKKLEDQELSIKIFNQKIQILEQSIDQINHQKQQIRKVKNKLETSCQQIQYLINKNQKYKSQIEQTIDKKFVQTKKTLNLHILNTITEKDVQLKQQIKFICLQNAKKDELNYLQSQINKKQSDLQVKLSLIHQKIHQNSQKNQQIYDFVLKQSNFYEKYLKDLEKQTKTLVKAEDFRETMKKYVRSEILNSDLKKHEHSYRQQLKRMKQTQQQINQIVCSQNIVMRWIWVSGQLKGGNLISWDRQVINTLPQNFVYQKDQYYFKIITSGIYKIEMGFYAKKKPTIQIIVNGQAIVSAVNSNSYVLHHSSGKLKDISNAQITGITYYDYYTIQQNSRIAISYCGQIGHGFIGLQRL